MGSKHKKISTGCNEVKVNICDKQKLLKIVEKSCRHTKRNMDKIILNGNLTTAIKYEWKLLNSDFQHSSNDKNFQPALAKHFFTLTDREPARPLSCARTEFYTTGGMLLLAWWIWNRDTVGDTRKKGTTAHGKRESVMIVTRRELKWSEIIFSSLWKKKPLDIILIRWRSGMKWARLYERLIINEVSTGTTSRGKMNFLGQD